MKHTVHSGGQMIEFRSRVALLYDLLSIPKRIKENQQPIPEEIQKVVNRNFMDLTIEKNQPKRK